MWLTNKFLKSINNATKYYSGSKVPFWVSANFFIISPNITGAIYAINELLVIKPDCRLIITMLITTHGGHKTND